MKQPFYSGCFGYQVVVVWNNAYFLNSQNLGGIWKILSHAKIDQLVIVFIWWLSYLFCRAITQKNYWLAREEMNLCKVKMGIREPSPTLIQPEYFLQCFLSIKTWYPEDSDKFGLGHPSHWNTELRCWNLWDQMSFCRWFFGGMKSYPVYPVLFRDYFVKETRINGTWTNLDFNGSMSMSFVSCVFQKLLPSLRTNSECPWKLNLLPQKESSFHFLTKISRGKQCCSFWGVYTLSYTNIAMENGPGMKMYFLL